MGADTALFSGLGASHPTWAPFWAKHRSVTTPEGLCRMGHWRVRRPDEGRAFSPTRRRAELTRCVNGADSTKHVLLVQNSTCEDPMWGARFLSRAAGYNSPAV